jgi:hypothetical protein
MQTTPNGPCRTARAAVLAVFALLLCLPGLAPAAPPPLEDDFRFYPPNADLVFVVHMDKFVASEAVQKLRKEYKDFDMGLDGFRKQYGLALTDVERFAAGGNLKTTGLMVLRSRKAVKAADIVAALKEPRFEGDKGRTFKETPVGNLTLYEPTEFGEAFCVVDANTVLFGQAKDLKAALERKGKAEAPPGLKKALTQVDRNATAYFALDARAALADDPNAFKGMDFPGGFNAQKAIASTELVTGSATFGNDMTFRMTGVCKDEKTAAALKADVEKGIADFATFMKGQKNVPPELLPLPGMVKVTTEGNTVRGSLTLKNDLAVPVFKALFMPEIKPPEKKEAPPKPPEKSGR